MVARLESITVSGFKSLGNITLPLDGLSVLIGDNGSGKSSILEVLEILRCTTHENFVGRIASAHGGMHQLCEHGAETVTIVATIDDGEPDALVYSQEWSAEGALLDERVFRESDREEPFTRDLLRVRSGLTGAIRLRSESLIFAGFSNDSDIALVAEVLRGIEVHLPFEVTAHWAAASDQGVRSAAALTTEIGSPKIRPFVLGRNIETLVQAAAGCLEPPLAAPIPKRHNERDKILGRAAHTSRSVRDCILGHVPTFAALVDAVVREIHPSPA